MIIIGQGGLYENKSHARAAVRGRTFQSSALRWLTAPNVISRHAGKVHFSAVESSGDSQFPSSLAWQSGLRERADPPELLARQFGTARKLQHGRINIVGGPCEFRLEDAAEFVAYRFGNRKTDAAIFRRLDKLVGETPELKRGDVDIGVGGDPDHLSGLAAALAGIRLSGGEHRPR